MMARIAPLLMLLTACEFPRPADVVSCTPGEFAECRGSTQLTCSAAGTDYDTVQCALGCEPLIGCRLCEPNQTICANGKVQSCDATGSVTSSEACALGCFEDQPRCREIDPSNNLAQYFDMVADPPDMDLSSGAVINTSTGVVTTSAKIVLPIPTFLLAGQNDGAQIRVMVARNIHLHDVVIENNDRNFGGPALALLGS